MALMSAAWTAHRAGKKHFEYNGKRYKTSKFTKILGKKRKHKGKRKHKKSRNK